MIIQPLTSDDDLVSLNKLLVQSWYKEIDGIMEVVPWENLTAQERFMHGGYWNDPDCLKIHLDSFLQFGNVLTAKEGEELVGELEYHIAGDELHLDWIMTHPNFQRQGIATALIKEIEQLHPEIHRIRTETEELSKEFYRALSFQEDLQIRNYIREHTKFSEKLDWHTKFEMPQYLIGIGENTQPYFRHLLRIQPQLAKLFGVKNPVTAASDGKITIIRRRFLGMENIFSIYIGAESELTEQMLLQANKYLTDGSFRIFMQTRTKLQLPNWQLQSSSKMLVKQI